MKIVLDARFFGADGGGIGRYTDNLLSNLSEIDKKNEYVVILRKSNFHLFNPVGDNFKKILIDAHWYSIKEQILLPLILYKEKPDLVHFPHFNIPVLWNGKFVVTVHDLIFSRFGQAISQSKVYPLKKTLYELILKKGVSRAEKIMVPSSSVRKELLKKFKVPGEKVVVAYEGAEEVFTKYGEKDLSEGEKKKVLATYGIKEPFIITVGNSYPYKNVGRVLEALENLPGNLNLVHVTKRDTFSMDLIDQAKNLNLSKRLIITGHISDEDLASLYNLSEAFVFPSISEGFGLPGLEAMAAGAPVICSDIVVFREVYGEGALYFNPNKPVEISEKVSLILHDSKLKVEMIKKGFLEVEKYSWRKMAQQTLDVYNTIL
ncbi:MAG: glycosyltransferase family 1 protein [Candidatus Woykebacteria bacterium]